MNKNELLALGLTGDQCRAVQDLCWLEVKRELKKARSSGDTQLADMRSTLVKYTYMLSYENMKSLLVTASGMFARDTAGLKRSVTENKSSGSNETATPQ